jgi:hypothetical protein
MKKFVFLCILVSCQYFASAQVLDSICKSFQYKPKFFFSFTQFNSFVSSEPANITGLRAGLEYNKTVRIGLGYSWLSSQIVDLIARPSPELTNDMTNGLLKFRYCNASFEYIFLNKNQWLLTLPLQIGIGSAHYEYLRSVDKKRVTTEGHLVTLFEPSITAQYSILDWVGVTGGFGYRKSLTSTRELKKDFDSPIYVLKLKIFFDVIYNDFFSKESIKEEK